MKILAVAALALELKPWLRRCQSLKKLNWPLSYSGMAQWNGATLYAVANGPGPRLAAHALHTALLQTGPFDRLMSIGLCGALSKKFPLHAICTASEVGDGRNNWPAEPIPDAIPVRLLSIDRFLGQPDEKQLWAEKCFEIVEMEAAAVAKYAAANNIRFCAVKVVSDRADERFALDFNKYRDAAGRFKQNRIALAALAHPIKYAPGLIRMASRGPAASETLGVFLANSQF